MLFERSSQETIYQIQGHICIAYIYVASSNDKTTDLEDADLVVT